MSGQGSLAAVDCGTNSTRLLVASAEGVPLERLVRITRLGRGVDRTRLIAPEAVERTIEVLGEFRSVMDRHDVVAVRMIATSAARDATNRREFFGAAKAAIGVEPELLPGDEEGRLSFVGATSDLAPTCAPRVIADIGGGSTEIVVGSPGAAEHVVASPRAVRNAEPVLESQSIDVGCVRMTERFLHHDPPTPGEIAEAMAYIGAQLDDVGRNVARLSEPGELIGLAGTVISLAVLDLGLGRYEREAVHHHRLEIAAVEELTLGLLRSSIEQKRAMPGMEPDRADVIAGGAAILLSLMKRFGFDTCIVSEADILDGVVAGLRQVNQSGRPG